MTDSIDRHPTRLGSYVAVVLSVLVLLLAIPYSTPGTALAAAGLATMGVVTLGGWRSLVDFGGLLLALAVVTTGVSMGGSGGGSEFLSSATILAMAVAAVVAWDSATNAIDMGEQLGRDGDTTRAEATHVAASAVVGLFAGGVGLGVFQVSTGGQPVTALAVLLIAMLVLISALRI